MNLDDVELIPPCSDNRCITYRTITQDELARLRAVRDAAQRIAMLLRTTNANADWVGAEKQLQRALEATP